MVCTIHQFKQEMKSWAAFYRVIASKSRVENQKKTNGGETIPVEIHQKMTAGK